MNSKTIDLHRAVTAICLLAGCSGSLSQGTPSGAVSVHRTLGRSWVDTSDRPAIFVSSPNASTVYGYSQKTGRETEEISGLAGPGQLATDVGGNLYVSTSADSQVLVFLEGSTKPSLTLTGAGPSPVGLAVSRKGEVAVVSSPDGGAGNVVFYEKGAKKPFSTIPTGGLVPLFDVYDSKGNLWLDSAQNGAWALAEVVGGGRGRQLVQFRVSPNLSEPSGVAVDGADHILVADGETLSVYQYQLPNPSQPTATILLTGAMHPVGIALTKSEASIYDADDYANAAQRFAYPAGGSATQSISVSKAVGVAVIPEAKP